MRRNSKSTEQLPGWRQIPAVTKQEEISPKTPCCCLRGYKERVLGAEAQSVMQRRRHARVSRKEGRVRDFHHLVRNRRNDGLVAPVHDIGEPVTVVLDQRLIAVFPRSLRG